MDTSLNESNPQVRFFVSFHTFEGFMQFTSAPPNECIYGHPLGLCGWALLS